MLGKMDVDSSDDEGDNPTVRELIEQRVQEQEQHRREQQQLLSMLQALEARINAQQALGGTTAPNNTIPTAAAGGGQLSIKVLKPDLYYGERSKYEE